MQMGVVADAFDAAVRRGRAEDVKAGDDGQRFDSRVKGSSEEGDFAAEAVAEQGDLRGIDLRMLCHRVDGGAGIGDHFAHQRPAGIAGVEVLRFENTSAETDLIEGEDGEAALDEAGDRGALVKAESVTGGGPGRGDGPAALVGVAVEPEDDGEFALGIGGEEEICFQTVAVRDLVPAHAFLTDAGADVGVSGGAAEDLGDPAFDGGDFERGVAELEVRRTRGLLSEGPEDLLARGHGNGRRSRSGRELTPAGVGIAVNPGFHFGLATPAEDGVEKVNEGFDVAG